MRNQTGMGHGVGVGGKAKQGFNLSLGLRRWLSGLERLESREMLSGVSGGAGEVEAFGEAPAVFVENVGQWDSHVRYVHSGQGMNIGMTDAGIEFQLFKQAEGEAKGQVLSFGANLVGALGVSPVGLDKSGSTFNYQAGDASMWRADVAGYETVAYNGVYAGVDMLAWGKNDSLKYEFHVSPGGDYSQIAIEYTGIAGLSLAGDGSLLIDLGGDWGVMSDDPPYVYQWVDGNKVEVESRFTLIDGKTYGFEVTGAFDAGLELVLDPEVTWGSYAGTGSSTGLAVTLDGDGNVYLTGETTGSGWVSGGYDTTLEGSSDAYVVKLDGAGNHVWSTYLGGNSNDWGTGLAVDGSGNVYVAGDSWSSGWTSGGWNTSSNGGRFLVKLDAAGSHVWSTFGGGTSGYPGAQVGVDGAGNVYMSGMTYTDGWASGGGDTTHNGDLDGYVIKFTGAGAHVWSTFLGGSSNEFVFGMSVDAGGNVYVTGGTASSGWATGGYDVSHGGNSDGFVMKLDTLGNQAWSTYLGGSGDEYGYGVATDGAGNVYLTGSTASSGWVSGGGDTDFGGGSDGYAVKLDASGGHVWSTYLGGSGSQFGAAIAVDGHGRALVTGTSFSDGWVSGGWDTGLGGNTDGFLAALETTGGTHLYSSFVGGENDEQTWGIAVDGVGDVYLGGTTNSSGWLTGGWDTSLTGSKNGFLMKVNTNEGPVATGIADVTVDENSPDMTIDLSKYFTDDRTLPGDLTFTVESVSNPGIVTASITGTVLTLDFVDTGYGMGDITIKASDGHLSSTDTFGLLITHINQAPTVSKEIADFTVENGSDAVVIDFRDYFEDLETASEDLVYMVVANSDNGAVVATNGASPWILVLEFMTKDTGDTEITVWAEDPQGLWAQNTFVVTVTPDTFNNPPVILTPGLIEVDNNGGAPIVISDFGKATSPQNELPETYTYDIYLVSGGDLLEDGTVIYYASFNELAFKPLGSNTSGTMVIGLRATDNNGAWVEEQISIVIREFERPTVVGIGATVDALVIDHVDAVDVTFSEPVDVSSFNWEDVTLTRDGGENRIDAKSGAGIALVHVSGNTYSITGLGGVSNTVNYATNYVLTVLDGGVTDLSGNTLDGAATETFIIGTKASDTPGVVDYGGVVFEPGYTNSNMPVFSGTGSDGATVDVYDGETLIGQGFVYGSVFNVFLSKALSEGVHAITAVTRTVNNTATKSGVLSLVVDTAAPTVANISAFASERTLPVLQVAVRFSAALNLSTFTWEDISLTRNGGANLATSGISIALTNPANHTYTITVPAALMNPIGAYNLTVNGAGILNKAGSAVGNNKSSTWSIVAATPGAPTLDGGSEGKAGSGYTQYTTPTVTGTGSVGSTVEVYEGATLLATAVVAANGKYSAPLPALSVGVHTIKARALGGLGGAATGYSSDYVVTVETAPPMVANMSAYAAPRTVPVTTTAVRFSSAMDLSTVSAADFTLTRDGNPVPLASISIALTTPSTHTYTVTLPAGSNDLAGVYVLTAVGAGMKNLAGKAVSNSFTSTWTMLPKVVSMSVYSAPRTVPVTAPGIRFNTPINLATFTWADLTLTRNGGANLITSGVSIVATGDPNLYTIVIPGLLTGAAGTYVLTVTGAGVQSTSGLSVSNNGSTAWTQL